MSHRLHTFLAATDSADVEHVALRALTLHMLRGLVPSFFAEQNLAPVYDEALERCGRVPWRYDGTSDQLQAIIDAWFCRYMRGLPHPQPEPEQLHAAFRAMREQDELIYAWLLGEIAARCGVDVRVRVPERLYRRSSKLIDGYWVTHLVLLGTDYFDRPATEQQTAAWVRELRRVEQFVLADGNLDLMGEVAFCLRFLKHDASALLEVLRAAPVATEPHEQACALLALSAEK